MNKVISLQNQIIHSNLIKMKKVLSILLVVGMASMISCGPSAEEKAAAEKAIQDSIANVEKMYADSVAAAEMAAQEAAAAAEKMIADSIAAAEAAATKKPANKAKPKTKEEKKIEETKKVTGGRG